MRFVGSHTRQAGLGMIDACLAVIIFGLIFIGFLTMMKTSNANALAQRSTVEINDVFNAIISYYHDNQKLTPGSQSSAWPNSMTDLISEGYISKGLQKGASWEVKQMYPVAKSNTQFQIDLCVRNSIAKSIMLMLPHGGLDQNYQCNMGFTAIHSILSDLSGGQRYNLHFYTVHVGNQSNGQPYDNKVMMPDCASNTNETPHIQPVIQSIDTRGLPFSSDYASADKSPDGKTWEVHIHYIAAGIAQELEDYQWSNVYDQTSNKFNLTKLPNTSVGSILAITYCST